MRLLQLTGMLAILLTVAGCGTEPTDPGTEGTEQNADTLVPGAGSRYRFDVYALDAAGRQGSTVLNQGDFQVTAVNESYRGQQGLVTLLDTKQNRLLYVKYMPNGDLLYYYAYFSLLFYPPMGSAWVRFPFGGGEAEGGILVDSSYTSESGESERFLVEREATYLGTEEITVKGKRFATVKVEERLQRTLFSEGEPELRLVNVLTYWYAPELKYFVRIDAYNYLGNPADPALQNASRDVLVEYDVK